MWILSRGRFLDLVNDVSVCTYWSDSIAVMNSGPVAGGGGFSRIFVEGSKEGGGGGGGGCGAIKPSNPQPRLREEDDESAPEDEKLLFLWNGDVLAATWVDAAVLADSVRLLKATKEGELKASEYLRALASRVGLPSSFPFTKRNWWLILTSLLSAWTQNNNYIWTLIQYILHPYIPIVIQK